MINIPRSTSVYILLASITLGCVWGCASQREENQMYEQPDPLALVIKHRPDSVSNQISGHVSQLLHYSSIPYETYDLSLGDQNFTIPKSVEIIYLTADQVEQFSNQEVEQLVRFVADGSQLTILTPLYDSRFAYLLGLKQDASYELDKTAEGYQFNTDVFPSFEDAVFNPPGIFLHNGFKANQFGPEINILATAANDTTYPAILEQKIGRGRTVYFNTQHVLEKDYRGLVFSTSLRALEGIPYRIANVSSIFLDDFPAPLYDKKLPPIDEEYDITHATFVKEVWWPEMQALADSFKIDYTAMLAFNYNAVVVPPYDFDEWELSKMTVDGESVNTSEWIARDVRQSRHELGLHGYNHFSLWLKDWRNKTFMQTALQAAKKRWKIDNLGPFPRTYVPPTNKIDSVGLAALVKVIPQIKYMSSLYIGDIKEGEGREFGTDPLAPSLFDYPRITSGFVNDEISNFNQQSLYLYTGIWTHFIHPDDVFQIDMAETGFTRSRNPLGLGWHSNGEHDYGLYEVFKRRLQETVDFYPYIRFKTVSESVPIVKKWLSTQSVYQFRDSTLQVTTQTNQPDTEPNNQKFWFAYVSQDGKAAFERSLETSNIDYRSTSLWDGALYQFASELDSLAVPNLQSRAVSEEELAKAVQQYRQYTDLPEEGSEESGAGVSEWRDTRFEDAIAELQRNPASVPLQEKAIDLAIEFNRVEKAIEILEQRLLRQSQWNTEDIQRLLTYYGWEEQYDRAFTFLESLWEKYPEQSVIALKNSMVERYGVPGEQFHRKWTKRALALDPGNESLLKELVRSNQSKERWAEQKKYLQQLINRNPRSDSLYAYAFGQWVAYSSRQEALAWLQTFPDEADNQLIPMADDIAYMYADKGELTRAIVWGRKSNEILPEPELYWLLQQQRYYDFMTQSDRYLQEQPGNDSLRVFVGQQLVYENFRKEGFARLYPLFRAKRAPRETRQLVHTEIGYMNFNQKKEFYQMYPNFFSDSLKADLKQQYRINEGIKAGAMASVAVDNFDNDIATIGLFTEWGKRPSTTHRVSVKDNLVSSDIIGASNLNELYNLRYRYQRSYREQAMQSTLAGGIYIDEQNIHPDMEAGFWFTSDSSYTSGQLQFKPVFTNTAIQQDIKKLIFTAYREDYWFKSKWLQTGLSLTANWFTNDVLSYEGLSHFYINLPFSTQHSKLRPLVDLSYADATTSYLSGVPYYTPDQLFVKGVGLNYSYKDALYNPDFSAGAELSLKHDSRDGAFLSGSAQLSARINNYWELSLQGELSTSSVYRYNKIGFGISYLFPKTLRTK